MRCACIDIGSNTIRVLVADAREGRLATVFLGKMYTELGGVLQATRVVPAEVVRTVAGTVAAQRAHAERIGAGHIVAVGTAAIRAAANQETLCEEVRRRSGLALSVLSAEEEARLAFTGATRTLGRPLAGRVAVVDVGGGSCEIAVGTMAGGVEWWASVAVGSATLAATCLRSDPPGAAELGEAVERAAAAFAGLNVPPVDHAIAVGGSAASTARIVGPVIAPAALAAAVEALHAAPAAEVARRHDLEVQRVRLLPAGLLLLDAAARRVRRPLEVGRGGLREGAILELAEARPPPSP